MLKILDFSRYLAFFLENTLEFLLMLTFFFFFFLLMYPKLSQIFHWNSIQKFFQINDFSKNYGKMSFFTFFVPFWRENSLLICHRLCNSIRITTFDLERLQYCCERLIEYLLCNENLENDVFGFVDLPCSR